MFENEIQVCLKDLTASKEIISELSDRIKTAYTAPGRYYHNLTHLDNMVGQLLPVKKIIEDWTIVILAIAYHDIEYHVLENNNEEMSARIAEQWLNRLHVSSNRIERCKRHIVFTQGHNLSKDPDTNYFTDADLSILGSTPDVYQEYAEQISREYSQVPYHLYYTGRKNVLLSFLQRNTIFKTQYFKEKYEGQARINLARELTLYN